MYSGMHIFCGSEAGVCLACLCGDGGALAVLVERLVLVAELVTFMHWTWG